jgi:hypothetical protein
MIKRAGRKIPTWLSWPIGAERKFERASKQYRWFARGENRFKALGLHGLSDHAFFVAFDDGAKDLPRELFMTMLAGDYAQHTRNRFAGRKLVSSGR